MSEANSRGGEGKKGPGVKSARRDPLGVGPTVRRLFGVPLEGDAPKDDREFSWPTIVVVKGSRDGEGDMFVRDGQWMLDTDTGAVPAKGARR